jgi:hypothetical protein
MAEIGYQKSAPGGWDMFASDVAETNPQLVWPLSIEVYDRMRSEDAQVQSVLRAVTFPILSTAWMIDPAGASEEAVALIAGDLGLPIKGRDPVAPLRTKGRFSWNDHLRLALLSLPFGHSYFEQVFEIGDDGKAHLRKLAWRPHRTISKIDVAPDGGLVAIEQPGNVVLGSAFGNIRIPVDRLVAYVNDREGGNWLGRSMLRAAFKYWLLKDSGLRTQALTLERNGLGVPVMVSPPDPEGVEGAELVEWRKAQIDRGLEIAKAYRSGEYAGVSLPHGGQFTLNGVTGTLPDSDKPIRYYDEMIASAVLAQVLNLGGDNATGSYALGDTFAKIFSDSLNAVADDIRITVQQHVIEDSIDINFGPTERAPQLIFEPIGAQYAATAEAIKSLVTAGALTPDPALEAHLRQQYGLPVRADDGTGQPGAGAKSAREVTEIEGDMPEALPPTQQRALAGQVAAIFNPSTKGQT